MQSPRTLLSRLLEFAITVALIVFLLKLAVGWLKEIWWVLLIIGLIVLAVVIIYRIKKHNRDMFF